MIGSILLVVQKSYMTNVPSYQQYFTRAYRTKSLSCLFLTCCFLKERIGTQNLGKAQALGGLSSRGGPEVHLKNSRNWRCLKELMLQKKMTTKTVLFPSNQKCRIISLCISSINFISIQHIWHFSNQNGAFLCIKSHLIFFIIWISIYATQWKLENYKTKNLWRNSYASTKRVWPHCASPKIYIICFILMTLSIFSMWCSK